MKFFEVILALVYVAYSIDAAPALLNEISLKLQPPELPHHHHHHNSATPTKSSSTSTTSTTRKPTAEITHYEFVNLPDGYRFSYGTSDGQTRDETGTFKDGGDSGKILQVVGSYTYNGDDGKRYVVNYTADENGYNQTEGEAPVGLPPYVIATLAG